MSTESPESPAPAATTGAVADQIVAWQRDLIDLTKKNRALHFTHSKAATLEITAPSLSAIANRLTSSTSVGWTFARLDDEAPDERSADGTGEATGDEDRTPPAFPRPDGGLRTTKATDRDLDRSLTNLARKATTELMDRGLSVLYVGLGMLRWRLDNDGAAGDEIFSPLLLIPVTLDRPSPRDPYRLLRGEDDLRVNPTLAARLLADFEMRLPTLDDREDVEPVAYLEEVERLIAGRRSWSVESRAVLATFSFQKEAMYQDLVDHAEEIADHPLIQALVLGGRTTGDAREADFAVIPEDKLDQLAPMERAHHILDADASQRQCIAAALANQSFVMDGPPGTGKSQTIANVIAELLTVGKTVLFVSDKAAALDIVHARLVERGLGEFLLKLHSHKASRREVAQELGRALETVVQPAPPMEVYRVSSLVARRMDLNNYAAAVNERREPLGRSVLDVLGRLGALAGAPLAPPPAIGTDLAADTVAEILDGATELARAWAPVRHGDEYPWVGLANAARYELRLSELTQDLQAGERMLGQLGKVTERAADLLRQEWDGEVTHARALGDLLALAERRPDAVLISWLTESTFSSVRGICAERRRAAEEYHAATVPLERFGPRWVDIDPALASAWQRIHDDAAATLLPLNLVPADASEALLTNLLGVLDRTGATLLALAPEVATMAAALHIDPAGLTVDRLQSLATMLRTATVAHRPEAAWIESEGRLTSVEGAARDLAAAHSQFRAQREPLTPLFTDKALALDLPPLVSRIKGRRGLARLGQSARADRTALAAVSRTGKVSKAHIASLDDLVDWHHSATQLTEAEARCVPLIGPHYYSRDIMDLTPMLQAVTAARDAFTRAGLDVPRSTLAEVLGRGATPDPALVSAAERVEATLATVVTDLRRTVPHAESALVGETWQRLLAWLGDRRTGSDPLRQLVRELGDASGRLGSPLTLGQLPVLAELRGRAQWSRAAIDDTLSEDQRVLGPAYRGVDTDWLALDAAVAWAADAVRVVGRRLTTDEAAAVLETSAPADALLRAIDAWTGWVASFSARFDDPHRGLIAADLTGQAPHASEVLTLLIDSIGNVGTIAAFGRACERLAAQGLDGAIAFAVDRQLPADAVAAVVEKALLTAWLEATVGADQRLAHFRAEDRDAIVREFQELDRELVARAPAAVIAACNARRPRSRIGAATIIRREAEKKTRHMPVRRLLSETAPVVQALKPCLMMSPLTVSQFLPRQAAMPFDVVIFDEASQVRPMDAVNCIYRGARLIVAGDPKQLPPTSFFDASFGDDGDEWVEDQTEEYESILDQFRTVATVGSIPLRWHYRSQHEALIAYSNQAFYDNKLITFPGAVQAGPDIGLAFFHVGDGIYRRGGARDNPREAAIVVDRIFDHAVNRPDLSLGVVAFSESQAAAVEIELERRRRDRPELDAYFAPNRLHGVFVKNLESVQGDERDIIIFSVGYGPDEAGRITANFGPVNRPGGQRRLNVAITRARRRVEVVSSMHAADIPVSGNAGVLHVRRYLDFAERGPVALGLDLSESQGDVESGFEADVLQTVRSWGFDVVPQLGVSRYRIDLAVRDPASPGSYVLAIECDGAMYHSAKVARDRDRLRQEVLERLGWRGRIHRIWSTGWYSNRLGEEQRLRAAIEGAIAKGRVTVHPDVVPPAPAASTTYVSKVVAVDMSPAPTWTVPYREAKLTIHTRGVAMHDPYARNLLSQAVVGVVEREGPITRERVLQRVREAWGVGRAGSRIRAQFDAVIDTLARNHRIIVGPGSFLRLEGAADTTIVRIPDGPAARASQDVWPGELELAVALMVRDAHVATVEAVSSAVATLFGWSRRGPDVSLALERAITAAVTRGWVVRDGTTLSPGDQPKG